MTEEDNQEAGDIIVDELPAPSLHDARILITNDDGIASPGLQKLASRLSKDFVVVVVAPAEDMSGTGTALGRFDPEVGVELTKTTVDGIHEAYTVDGPPGLAVLAASLGAFGDPPDLVVSGINAGLNTGHSIIHSGTVGAALTARTLGSRGLAVSLQQSDEWQWDTAVEVARSAVDWVIGRSGERFVLNINVPGLPLDDVLGIHWADLDEFGHIRVATADVPARRLEFGVRGAASALDPACDTALCQAGYVTATLLSTVEPLPFPPEEPTSIWAHDGRGDARQQAAS